VKQLLDCCRKRLEISGRSALTGRASAWRRTFGKTKECARFEAALGVRNGGDLTSFTTEHTHLAWLGPSLKQVCYRKTL